MKMHLIQNQKLDSKRSDLIRNATIAIHLLLIFFIIYTVVIGLYFIWYNPLHNVSNNWFLFLTSPFGPIENLSSIYGGNAIVGFIWNGIEVGVVLVILTFYFNTYFNGYKKHLNAYLIFLYSVVATYITSAIIWCIQGSPSTGTSIIGASATAFIGFMLITDAIKALPKYKIRFLVFMFLFIFVMALILIFYFLGNEYWYVHLIGLVIFTLLICLWISLNKRFSFSNKADIKALYSVFVPFIFIVVSFLLFYFINSKLYYSNPSISNISIMFLIESFTAIFSAYRADRLTLKYVFNKRQAKELNPLARILYKYFGKSTIVLTLTFVALFSLIVYIIYFYIIFIRLIAIEVLMPIIMMVTFGDWLNDEIKSLFMRKGN